MPGAVCVSQGTLWAVTFQSCSRLILVSLQAASLEPRDSHGPHLCGQVGREACSGDPPEIGRPWGAMSRGSDGCHGEGGALRISLRADSSGSPRHHQMEPPESCAVGTGWVPGVVLVLSPRGLRVSHLSTERSRQQLRGLAFSCCSLFKCRTYVSVQPQRWVDTALQEAAELK